MIYKVYQHRRPDTNEIFYVGHGNSERPKHFLRGRSKTWQTIYNNYGCLVEILKTFDTKQEAADYETKVIAEYRQIGIPLVNKKDGGFDRNQGCPHDDDAKLKISRARLTTHGKRKKTKTPLGIFNSITSAAKAHNVQCDTIVYRIKKHNEGYKFCV